MSTSAQQTVNSINAQASTGPLTEEGRVNSSKNATKYGLFTSADYILPGEESTYAELVHSLNQTLTPIGPLELSLVAEIRRANWRLRRCAIVEHELADRPYATATLDEDAAKIQLSVDRARSLYNRLSHKCTAELRKLQTERQFRSESTAPGTDFSEYGIATFRNIREDITRQNATETRRRRTELDIFLKAPGPAFTPAPVPDSSQSASFCKNENSLPQTPRNAPCHCGSGQKHKRCCGKDAPPVLHAA